MDVIDQGVCSLDLAGMHVIGRRALRVVGNRIIVGVISARSKQSR